MSQNAQRNRYDAVTRLTDVTQGSTAKVAASSACFDNCSNARPTPSDCDIRAWRSTGLA